MTVTVSDHALLRWLERHHGMDLQPYREELAALVEPFVAIKAKSACVAPGLYAALAGNVVTTVRPGKPVPRMPALSYEPEKLNWKAMQRKRRHK